jgi:hypothetical protein
MNKLPKCITEMPIFSALFLALGRFAMGCSKQRKHYLGVKSLDLTEGFNAKIN